MIPIRSFALVLAASLVLAATVAQAQDTQTPIPQNLDEMIAAALRSNPEVLLADAKLRQAQAELNQARLKVTRDIVTAFNDRKQRQSVLAAAALTVKQVQQLAASGSVPQSDFERARAAVGESEIAVAQADAEVRYLIGAGSRFDPGLVRGAVTAEAAKRVEVSRPTNVPDDIVAALERPVTGPFEDTTLTDLTKRLAEQAKVSMLIDPQSLIDNPSEFKVSMPLREPVTLMSVLRAMSDQYDLCFILREYGILVTHPNRAQDMRAPAIPHNTPLDPNATK